MLRKLIEEDLKRVVKDLGYPLTDPVTGEADIVCTIPKNSQFGDYSTNLVLQLAKLERSDDKQSPQVIASEILEKFGKPDYLEKAEIAGGGFINFFVKKEFLANDIKEILESKEQFGKSEIGKGKKARVEFVSANPTGPLHFGNARGGPIGDVLANVLEFVGYKVLREYYDNNVGGQIKKLGESIRNIRSGSKLEDQEYKGHYVAEIAEKVGNFKDLDDAGKQAVRLLFEGIIRDCNEMGINFDKIYHESEFMEGGRTKEALKKIEKYLKTQDRAVWFAPSDEFLKDRETVVIKSDGSYTYFANDIAYHNLKFNEPDFGQPDLAIDVLGANHHGHVPRLQAAIKALGYDVSKFRVILYQWVRFVNLETLELLTMSKRLGTFVTTKEVLDAVGKDVVRFFILMHGANTHIDFDLTLAMKKSKKNPVFYVQYAHARMNNILVKAGKTPESFDSKALTHPSEVSLIKHLLAFPDLIGEIAENLQVHQLTEYSINLADLFHKFYENCPVLQAENEELVKARVALVKSSQIVLGSTLKLLGVSAPERM